ncbi:hypothetical protein FH972_021054 [Carpinus fangiana]|uniref:Mitochondrial outer membrane transport complex Sam37/metaxin N-terminal domain-containing protein n=1 Tax=Carpinus fangiana TaxID=176857 RepID=A0A5N6KNT2_9ROSI|nr:hypothetical protein FH972_021054 [Carpinus fangiana]
MVSNPRHSPSHLTEIAKGTFPALRSEKSWSFGYDAIVQRLSNDGYSLGRDDTLDDASERQTAERHMLGIHVVHNARPLLAAHFYTTQKNWTHVTRTTWTRILPTHANYTVVPEILDRAKLVATSAGLSSGIEGEDDLPPPSDPSVQAQLQAKGQLDAGSPSLLFARSRQTVQQALAARQAATRFRLEALMDDLLEPLVRVLGNGHSESLDGLDCLVYGYLAPLLREDVPVTWIPQLMRDKYPRVCDHVEQLGKLIFPQGAVDVQRVMSSPFLSDESVSRTDLSLTEIAGLPYCQAPSPTYLACTTNLLRALSYHIISPARQRWLLYDKDLHHRLPLIIGTSLPVVGGIAYLVYKFATLRTGPDHVFGRGRPRLRMLGAAGAALSVLGQNEAYPDQPTMGIDGMDVVGLGGGVLAKLASTDVLLFLALRNPDSPRTQHCRQHTAPKCKPPDRSQSFERQLPITTSTHFSANGVANRGEHGGAQILHRHQHTTRTPLIAARNATRNEDTRRRKAQIRSERHERHARHAQRPVRRAGRLRQEEDRPERVRQHRSRQDPVPSDEVQGARDDKRREHANDGVGQQPQRDGQRGRALLRQPEAHGVELPRAAVRAEAESVGGDERREAGRRPQAVVDEGAARAALEEVEGQEAEQAEEDQRAAEHRRGAEDPGEVGGECAALECAGPEAKGRHGGHGGEDACLAHAWRVDAAEDRHAGRDEDTDGEALHGTDDEEENARAVTIMARGPQRSAAEPETTTDRPFASINEPVSQGVVEDLMPRAVKSVIWLTVMLPKRKPKRSWPVEQTKMKTNSARRFGSSGGLPWYADLEAMFSGEVPSSIASAGMGGMGLKLRPEVVARPESESRLLTRRSKTFSPGLSSLLALV